MNNQNPNTPTSVERKNAQTPSGNPRATGNSVQGVNPNAGQSQGGANNQQRNQQQDFEQMLHYHPILMQGLMVNHGVILALVKNLFG